MMIQSIHICFSVGLDGGETQANVMNSPAAVGITELGTDDFATRHVIRREGARCEPSNFVARCSDTLGEEVNMQGLPPIVTLSSETSASAMYDNHTVTNVNDHVVRISTMTQTYHWHCHPNSDETFLVLEGGIAIEFEQGEIQLAAGQMATVSRGIRHRTRPLGQRSVNLTFEAADTRTELSQPAKDR